MSTPADRLCSWCEGGTLEPNYTPASAQFRYDLRTLLRENRTMSALLDDIVGDAYDREGAAAAEEVAAGMRAVLRLKQIAERSEPK